MNNTATAHLENAARTLEGILAAKHPEHEWHVAVGGEDFEIRLAGDLWDRRVALAAERRVLSERLEQIDVEDANLKAASNVLKPVN